MKDIKKWLNLDEQTTKEWTVWWITLSKFM